MTPSPLIISDALERVAPSPTIAMTQRGYELKAQGADVVALAAGEPDFPMPSHVADAAVEAIRQGKTQYTTVDGIPELKAAVADKFQRDNSVTYDPQTEITVTSGGKYVIYAALGATLCPGDEVIVPAPYWVSYPDIVRLWRGEPVIADTSEDEGFILSPQVFEAAITEKTRWLLWNTPSNPTGAVPSHAQLRAIADVLLRHAHVWVLADDIYEHITYDETFQSLVTIEPRLKDRILTMNGASKAYSMTGLRIGFAGGPAPLIAAIRKLLSQSTSNPCSISQWAAVAALQGDHSFLSERNAAFRQRRDFLLSVFAETPGVSCQKTEGAFYLYPTVRGLIGKRLGDRLLETDKDVAEALLEEELVALVPGSAFGKSPFLRLSYAASMDDLEKAAERMSRFCRRVMD